MLVCLKLVIQACEGSFTNRKSYLGWNFIYQNCQATSIYCCRIKKSLRSQRGIEL